MSGLEECIAFERVRGELWTKNNLRIIGIGTLLLDIQGDCVHFADDRAEVIYTPNIL